MAPAKNKETSKNGSDPVIARNRKAFHDYEIIETCEAGIVLVGTEIKSLRAGKASLQDAFCYFANGELYVKGMNIATYFWGSWNGHEPMRDRKLLLTKRELRHLAQAVKTKGLTIVAVRLYIAENGYARFVCFRTLYCVITGSTTS